MEVNHVLPDALRNSINAFFNVLQSIQIIDILDIVLLTLIIYFALRLVRETRAGQLLKGIVLLFLVYFISDACHLKAVRFISDYAIKAGAVAVVIIFQPELRRILERFGQTTNRLSRLTFGESDDVTERWEKAIPAIVEATAQLSATSTGALIVIERETKLGEQILNGTVMKATASTQLFGNIFYPKTPLHDGAVIMRDGYIWAAACFLPKPQKEELIDKHLGSRHRAAIGMSENSDALIIVVSEETGQISVADNGNIKRDYTPEMLRQLLVNVLILPEKERRSNKKFRLPFFRGKSKTQRGQQEEKGD